MEIKNNFTCSISAKISAIEATNKISNVTDWWGVTFTGSAKKRRDNFVVKMGGNSFFNFTVREFIPGKRIVWYITDCNMPWYSNHKEWAKTNIIFNLSENNGMTTVDFMHEGLTPDIECYEECNEGWTHWIKTSLFSYLTTGKGVFRASTK